MRLAILFTLLGSMALGDDKPVSPIRLPISKVPVVPAAVTELSADAIFVVESDIACIVLASRDGYVTVTQESGPLRMRGRFADGKGVETRTYTAKFLFIIEPSLAGEIELLVIPTSAKDAAAVVRRTLVVSGEGPRPPPVPPGPTPDPPKPVDPTPIPVSGNRLLIVYESEDAGKMPPLQAAIMTSTVLRSYLSSRAATARFFDPDQVFTQDDMVWQDAMKIKRGPLPWLLVSNGTSGFSGPLPATVDEVVAVCDKYFAPKVKP